MITLYILQSSSNEKKYIGITNNLKRRLKEHSNGSTKAGQILGVFQLLYTESYENYAKAREREKFLKSGQGRKWMKAFQLPNPPKADRAG